MKIAGRSLLGHVLARARRVRSEGIVVIATSSDPLDDAIVSFGDAEGVPVFRGALEDVGGRALACAQAFGMRRFARICGDRPFFEPELVDRLLVLQSEKSLDLATNAAERTFPAGVTTEVVTTAALDKVLAETDDPADREHFTRYFYRCPAGFRIENVRCENPENRDISLVVDTAEDLSRARFIASHYPHDVSTAPLAAIIELARAWYAR
jgi:spore coat polysaccharide biosynthesis protein SpsF